MDSRPLGTLLGIKGFPLAAIPCYGGTLSKVIGQGLGLALQLWFWGWSVSFTLTRRASSCASACGGSRTSGTWSDGRGPLDLEALFAHLRPDDDLDMPLLPDTRIGHVHLHVADLDEAMHFYHDILGFDDQGLMHLFRMGMVSAGGYHHHIGFNTSQGEGAPPPPPDAVGLRWFSVVLPDTEALEAVLARVRAG